MENYRKLRKANDNKKTQISSISSSVLLLFLSGGLLQLSVALLLVFVRFSLILKAICAWAMFTLKGAGGRGGVPTLLTDRKSIFPKHAHKT